MSARAAIIRALDAKGGNIYWTDEELADAVLAELRAAGISFVERGEWVFDGVSGVDEPSDSSG